MVKTVFMGPVQTVESKLNYTKFRHFLPLKVAENGCGKSAKAGGFGGFAQLSSTALSAGFERRVELHCNESIRLCNRRFSSGSVCRKCSIFWME